jgi:2TM domain
MVDERSYKNEDVRAIIDRALEAQPQEGVTHADLLAIGAEVGLSSAAIERAALDVREQRLSDAARAHVLARRRRGLLAHALAFFAINAFLFVVNFLTTPGQWWVLFPVFGWGFGLILHAIFGLSKAVSPGRLNRAKRRLERRGAEERSAHLRIAPEGERARVLGGEPELERERDERESPVKRTL